MTDSIVELYIQEVSHSTENRAANKTQKVIKTSERVHGKKKKKKQCSHKISLLPS